jgi:hypothetical protein
MRTGDRGIGDARLGPRSGSDNNSGDGLEGEGIRECAWFTGKLL